MTRPSAPHRLKALTALAAAGALTFGFAPVGDTTDTATATDAFAPQLVTVDTPTRAHKDLLSSLGLDLTEHAGHDYVEVVLHAAADEDLLREAGLSWDVRIADLWQREAEVQDTNRAYAAATETSPLPSGRDTYRTLEDYNSEMAALAEAHPDTVKLLELAEQTLEGRTIYGLEISDDVQAPEDGRPTFVMLGLHHAREWPSGEHTMEFAYDLINGHGTDARITGLLEQARVVIVPVSNPDGFNQSVTDGMNVDLRELDGGGTVSILATPSNAYKRKNCRIIDGQTPLAEECTAAKSPGGFGVGIDTNRNYGAFWGGPGASDTFADPTYHGAGPFSEPETQAVRELVSSRQVTTLITNHTFGNLLLRPNGVAPDTIAPDGQPVGYAPDEQEMKELGARMTAQNGYSNQHGWELYDTTGTTEDWSYNATGGYGYTFEIGPNEFHPPFPQVVDEYLGAGEYAGKGNREAYLIALENAVDASTHAVLEGKAPAGATLRLTRVGSTPTWEGSFTDRVETTMVVGEDGRFTWHVNPSTRPLVESRQIRVTSEEPIQTETFEGTTPAPAQHVDTPFTVQAPGDLLEVTLDWPLPDDLDLEVYRVADDGSLEQVGSSGAFVGEKERVLIENPEVGDYVLRVINFAAASPTYTLTASVYDSELVSTVGLLEAWTLSCEVDGEVVEQQAIVVDRGQHLKADLKECRQATKRR